MSLSTPWSYTYRIFGPYFYDLVGYYELQFNRDPKYIVKYDKSFESSEILPIYGESHLPPYAMYLCQLPIVNRLTEIKQLAYTFILFPGATHTRYEHSRGVMHRSFKILNKIKKILEDNYRDNNIIINNDDKIILNVAALLHDLGHPACGHALDGITGYVVQLLEEISTYLFSPRKLDITITVYLLLKNYQLEQALNMCSNELKNKTLRKFFTQIIAQIIMEEEYPLFEELEEEKKIMIKTHLLTTILGSYTGRSGINVDRLDWFIRDSHHSNLQAKLSGDEISKYLEFLELNKKEEYKIGINNCEFAFIDDDKFKNLRDELRDSVYSIIFEGIERSFSDSLLMRLAYSTIYIINTIGNDIASSPITTKAIMGYLLMPDHQMKEYTNKSLHLAIQHTRLLGMTEPITTFIANSYNLLKIMNYIKGIMHYLSNNTIKEGYTAKMSLCFKYLELKQIDKNLIIVTAKTFSDLIKRACVSFDQTDISKLAILFQDILVASRINAIGALRVPALESALHEDFRHLNIYLLINYYFFRKLDDFFRAEIVNFSSLKKVLEEKMEFTPLFFIISDETDLETMEKIFEKLFVDVLSHFVALFKSVELPVL